MNAYSTSVDKKSYKQNSLCLEENHNNISFNLRSTFIFLFSRWRKWSKWHWRFFFFLPNRLGIGWFPVSRYTKGSRNQKKPRSGQIFLRLYRVMKRCPSHTCCCTLLQSCLKWGYYTFSLLTKQTSLSNLEICGQSWCLDCKPKTTHSPY